MQFLTKRNFNEILKAIDMNGYESYTIECQRLEHFWYTILTYE